LDENEQNQMGEKQVSSNCLIRG